MLCQDAEGVRYIIEMQVAKTKGFEKRAQYYAAKAYAQQADKGKQYYDLKEIIFIAIADCVLFPNKAGYKSDHIILDRDSYDHDLKDFSFTFIELPKFTKQEPSELKTLVEKWCYFFKYADETQMADLEKIIGSDQIIKRAYEALDQFYWSENELALYERERKRVRDEAAIFAQKLDDAVHRNALAIAKNLLNMGADRDVIKKATGLSEQDLRSLED